MNGLGITGGGYTGIGVTGQDVLIYGNLLVTGGIDPIYLALTPQPSGPQGFTNPLWVDSVNGNALRSNNIYMNVESTNEYISLKPDNNTAQIILSDGGATATTNELLYGSITLTAPPNSTTINSQDVTIVDASTGFQTSIYSSQVVINNNAITSTLNAGYLEVVDNSKRVEIDASAPKVKIDNGAGFSIVADATSSPNIRVEFDPEIYADYGASALGLTDLSNNILIDAFNPNIVITDGTATNTITKNGMSGTATSATAITITDSTTTAGTFYPTFVNSDGNGKSVRIDTNMSYSAVNNTLTCSTFAGTATRATNIAGGTGGSIPYQSAVNTTVFLANGSTGQVLTSNGGATGPSWTTPTSSTIAITNTETNATFYPTFVSGSGAGQTLRADITATPFSFNPALGDLRRTIADATTETSFSMTSINTATGSGNNRYSKLSCNSGRNVPSVPPTARLSAQMDDQSYSECIIGGTTFDLNTTQLFDEDSLKAGVIGYKEVGGTPVSVLYNNNTNFVPGNVQISGVRVKQQPSIIEIFDGASTIDGGAVLANFFTNGVVGSAGINFSQILAFALGSGVKENSSVNATTTGSTNLSVANDAFETIINTPADTTRVFVLPTPSASIAGCWFGICNKATTAGRTIAIQYPSGTTIFTIPVATNAGGGSFAKFAVNSAGTGYFTCG
jgi:hypothetical protein